MYFLFYMAKKEIKFVFLLLVILPVLFFLNTGFLDTSFWKIAQTIAFSLIFSFILVWPKVRKYIFLTSGFFIVVMSTLFVAGRMTEAELFGSTGFGLVVLVLIGYLPQFIKKGYVEKI